MSKCPKCGKEIGNQLFCDACGTRMTQQTVAADAPLPGRKCPKCGANAGEGKFCERCGARLDTQPPVPPQPGSAYRPPSQAPGAVPPPYPPQNHPPFTQAQQPKKKSAVPIVITIAAVVALLAVAAIVLIFVLKPGSSDDTAPNAAGTVSTAASAADGTVPSAAAATAPTTATQPTTAAALKMPAVKNQKLTDAKKQLESFGVTIVEKYEFSDTVPKDSVISQSVAEGATLHKGDTVTLTISKGSDVSPYDYQQKLTGTAASGSSFGTAVLYEWKNGDWSPVATYNAAVGANGIGAASEGSSLSPQGVHKMGAVLTAQSFSTNMNVYKVNSNTCVVDDSGSALYNQIMDKGSVPSGTHYDNIGKGLTDGSTNAMIYIEHNGSGFSSNNVVPGKGSAIGIRGRTGSLTGTYGDVDISASDMVDLLSRLDAGKNPMIELKTN